jgi:hypothetical protein
MERNLIFFLAHLENLMRMAPPTRQYMWWQVQAYHHIHFRATGPDSIYSTNNHKQGK